MPRVSKTQKKSITWTVAIYIRLSKEDGNDVSYSVINQEKRLRKHVEEMDEPLEIYNVYIDDGRTGTDSNRESFQQMLQDIRDGYVNCVVVKDLSRLSRNYAESGLYLEQFFVERNTRFISLELPTLDSYLRPDEVSSIATAFQNIVNDDFCRQTSIKIRGTFNRKRSDGEFIGAFAPYGYKKDPENKNKLIVDKEPAKVIKDIFTWFIDGESKRGITIKLNDLGILSPTAYKHSKGFNYQKNRNNSDLYLWSHNTVDAILKNQMYLGHMIQGKKRVKSYKVHKLIQVPEEEWFIVENTHEAIISQEMFDKAEDLLNRNVKTANFEKKTYLFSGFLKCADCRKAMHRHKSGKYVYYSCHTYKEQSKKACTKHGINDAELIQAVTDTINLQIALIEDKKKLIDGIKESPQTKNRVVQIDNLLRQKTKEIEKVNRIRDGLYMDWKNEDITRDDYMRLRALQDEKLTQLRDNLTALREELKTIETELNTESPVFELFQEQNRIEQIDRSLLIEFVEQIYIEENKKIKIHFKFKDQINHILSLVNEHEETIENKEKTISKKLSF